jgi:hypothetical protein
LQLTAACPRRCAHPIERIRVLEDSRVGAMWLSGASVMRAKRNPRGVQNPRWPRARTGLLGAGKLSCLQPIIPRRTTGGRGAESKLNSHSNHVSAFNSIFIYLFIVIFSKVIKFNTNDSKSAFLI